MPTYKAPVEDVQFLLNDVFHMERYGNLPGFADASPDVRRGDPGGSRRSSPRKSLQPLNRVGDLEGCKRHRRRQRHDADGLQGSLPAIRRWRLDRAFRCRPNTAGRACPARSTVMSTSCSARRNMAFSMYPGLTQGAIAALLHHGSAEQKKTYLPKMTAGEWTGTMNLTEPHCGTDLGLLAHQGGAAGRRQLQDHRHQDLHLGRRARSWRRTSSISCSRASKARRPAPRGISLFVVPKFLVECRRLGRRAQRRDVRLDRAQDGHPRQLDLRASTTTARPAG